MSIINKQRSTTDYSVGNTGTYQEPKIYFDIKDTDFLLRLFNSSHIIGADISQANSTLSKLKGIHNKLSNALEEV